MFHAVFERQARRSFDLVNQHDYDSILASATPDIHHRFGGRPRPRRGPPRRRPPASLVRAPASPHARTHPHRHRRLGRRRTAKNDGYREVESGGDAPRRSPLRQSRRARHPAPEPQGHQHRGRRRLPSSRLRSGASGPVRADRGAGGPYHELRTARRRRAPAVCTLAKMLVPHFRAAADLGRPGPPSRRELPAGPARPAEAVAGAARRLAAAGPDHRRFHCRQDHHDRPGR